MDFRNQKITDILYAVAETCEQSVIIDETVTGNATFRFEDKNFESALKRFAEHCQLYVTKKDDIYTISKVKIETNDKGNLSINTENVQVEPFINMLSRYTNRTILFDTLPNATVTIRTGNATLEDILNLTIVKLPNFGLERIADGYYITKSNGSINRRDIDILNISETGGLFSCNIQKASFVNVIETLFKKGSREYSLLSKPTLTIENMTYSDKPFEQLLSLILDQSGFDFSIKENVYYIYEVQKRDIIKKFKETRIVAVKNMSIDMLVSLFPSDLNASGFIKLDKNSNSIILSGSPSEIDPIEDFINKTDIPINDKMYQIFYLENITVKDAAAAIPKSMLFSEIIPLPSANGFITQVTSESGKKLEDYLKILDDKKQTKIVKLKYLKTEDLIKTLPPSVTRDNIIETNDPTSFFFSGTDKQYEEFSKDLSTMDSPRQQIKYQLFVIQRQKNEGLNFGTNYNIGNNNGQAGYTWSGMLSNIFNINFDVISNFGVQFAGNLNAELSEGKARVLADTTLNGISGESLNFSNTNTYRYRDIIVDTSGDLYTSTTREITSGLTLSINGWVSGDGMITVKVDAVVSKQGNSDAVTQSNTVTDSSIPPSTSEKKVSTNVRTKSGEPVVIGGLFQQEEDVSEKKIPILGSIPWLGNLFKSRNTITTESEFIIYLVPSVYNSNDNVINEEENLIRLKEKYPEDK
jgi:type II secretory pathway component GspD/PulD (secretin)